MLAWKVCTVAALLAATAARADDAPMTLAAGSAQALPRPSAGTLTMTGPLSGTGTVMFMASDLASDYWLGVVATRPSPALHAQLNLPKDQGLLVEALQPESPAVKAGLQQYDILLKGNDKPLTGIHDLMQLIGQVKDGKLTLELLRAGKHETVTVTPAKRPAREPGGMAGLPLVFNFVHPGQILPPGATLYLSGGVQELSDGSKVEIAQHGSEPAKVVVTHGKDKWEGTSADLSKIPEKIRPEVEKLLRAGGDDIRFFPRMGEGTIALNLSSGTAAAPGIPGQLTMSRDIEKRFGELQKQVGELQKQVDEIRQSVDALQGKAKEKSPAKPE